MLKLGPITIVSSNKMEAYKEVHEEAAILHNELWFTDNWEAHRQEIIADVMELGEALSHLPDPL